MKTLLFLTMPIFLLSLIGNPHTQQQALHHNLSDTTITNAKIYFDNGSSKIKTDGRYSDNLEQLKQVVKYLKNHTSKKLVITGSSEEGTSIQVSEIIAYQRAKNTIEWLVNNHHIDRKRLFLNYSYRTVPLCSIGRRAFRSATFKIATNDDKEMPRPKGL